MEQLHDVVLVVDFGAQYAQLIARRVREANVYSEIVPHNMPVRDMLAKEPAAIILSGGPASVYAEGAPSVDPALFNAGVPVLGICYGFQAMAQALGGQVAHTGASEYGRTSLCITSAGQLLSRIPHTISVWMSHGDSVSRAPEGFSTLARTAGAPVAAFEDVERRLVGVQWHPEVHHTESGQTVLEHFLFDIAGCRPDWNASSIVGDQIAQIRGQVGDRRVICGLSGGVDSAVAAALVQRAVGDQLTCVFVDHGLLRQGEAEQVKNDFVAATGADLVVADESQRFLDALPGSPILRPSARSLDASSFGPLRTLPSASMLTSRSTSWCRELYIPTSLSLVAARALPISRVTIMLVGSPTTSSSVSLSHCAPSLRTRCEPSDLNLVCPRTSSGVSPSLARGWLSALLAKSPRSVWRCYALPMPSHVRKWGPQAWTARYGSARSSS